MHEKLKFLAVRSKMAYEIKIKRIFVAKTVSKMKVNRINNFYIFFVVSDQLHNFHNIGRTFTVIR